MYLIMIICIKSNHNYNCDYICLEISSERNQNTLSWLNMCVIALIAFKAHITLCGFKFEME